jgi:hypothetical protein
MTRFRTRRMTPDDAPAFNNAYNSLNVSPYRPLEDMHRIWQGGPGGPVKSWIVEADSGAGWQLIGHHGLCPVRFTLGELDLLFAKTVNSFLLPDFRNRFVYLRFEQRCLAEVEREFDATYTLAQYAVRIRTALGYDTGTLELDFEQGLRAPSILPRLLMRMIWRFPRIGALRPWHALPRRKSCLALTELDDATAKNSHFFADFWDEARMIAGLSPRRDAADLAWRFWGRPGRRTTLTHTWSCGARGYGIVSTSDGLHFCLEDVFLSTARPDLLGALLDAILSWCADNGGLMLSFMTTAESQPPQMLAAYREHLSESLSCHHRGQHLSRRLTTLGRERIGAEWPPMNITPLAAVA